MEKGRGRGEGGEGGKEDSKRQRQVHSDLLSIRLKIPGRLISAEYKEEGFPGGAGGKEPLPANAGDMRDTGSISVGGRSPGGEHGNPLQYSCLENPMDRGAWQATVYSVAKSQTQLK